LHVLRAENQKLKLLDNVKLKVNNRNIIIMIIIVITIVILMSTKNQVSA